MRSVEIQDLHRWDLSIPEAIDTQRRLAPQGGLPLRAGAPPLPGDAVPPGAPVAGAQAGPAARGWARLRPPAAFRARLPPGAAAGRAGHRLRQIAPSRRAW